MTTGALLAIDLGTGSVKVLVVDREGHVLGSASAPYPVYRPFEGWAEQKPDEWWNATVKAMRSALVLAGNPAIHAIGISGQMHGTVLIDARGQPVRDAIIWEDSRSAVEVEKITRLVGEQTFIECCGSAVATGFQVATLAWLQAHDARSLSAAASVLLPGDFIRFKLSGKLGSEPSGASSTVLFDIQTDTWANDILSTLGLKSSLYPGIYASSSVAGTLHANAAAELGLPMGIPIAAGGGDAPLAALASGATTPDTLLLTISTGSQTILPAEQPVTDPAGRIHTWRSVADRQSHLPLWYQMGATLASGRALRWLRDEIMFGAADDLELSVAAVQPGADGLIFLPYLNGERTPHMDPHAAGAFIGLRASHGAAEMSRAVMEGASFALRDAFAVLEELGGAPNRIVLAGGGARSPVWAQIFADIFDMPVDPLAESEGSAMGAAIVAGTSIGWFSLQEGATFSARFAERIYPRPAAVEIYREIEPIFGHSYALLRDDFHALAEIAARARSISINA